MRSLRSGVVAIATLLVAALVGTHASAADTMPVAKKPAPRPVAKKPPVPVLPAPSVSLDIEAPAQGPMFTMHLKNTGAVPLRIVTDVRLLRITLPPLPGPVPKGKKAPKPIVCSVPAANRPQGDGDARVLPAGKTYVQKFDVRTLCFSADASAALDAATRISAAYGFDSKSLLPPYVVSPLDPTESEPAPTIAAAKDVQMAEKDLVAHAIVPKVAPVVPSQAGTPRDADIGLPRLRVTATARIDTDSADSATLTTTLKNESSRPVTLALRPFVVVLDVTSPSGRTATCNVAGNTALSRDLLATIGAGREASVSVALGRFCNNGTFDERGIYSVLAHIDTRKTDISGRSDGIFLGEVAAATPTLVRVRSGAVPIVNALKPRID